MKIISGRMGAAALGVSLAFGAAAHAADIGIMSIQAMSGPYAFAGVSYANGIKLAVEQAEADHYLGDTNIKLQMEDNAGDKNQAINLANQAVRPDGPIIVLGPTTTVDTLAVAPVFNDNKTPLLSLATSSLSLETGPWIFNTEQNAGDLLPVLTHYLLTKTDLRKIAIIYDRSSDGYLEQRDTIAKTVKEGGGEIVASEAVTGTDTNFLPLVTKMMGVDIDAIYLAVTPEQGANLMIQFRQAGLPDKVHFMGGITLASPSIMEMAGQAAEGTYVIADYIAGVDRPVNKAFEEAFQKKFNAPVDQFAAVGYTMGKAALKAIKDAGAEPTREKVRDALLNIGSVPSPLGNGSWTHKDRHPHYGAIVTMIKDGKLSAIE